MALKRVALIAVVAAVALVPTAAASTAHHHAKLRLALVPLQAAQLGPAGASLALNYDSGAIASDGSMEFELDSGNGGFGIFESDSSPRGLMGGYALDYGDPFTGSTGVTDVRSSVEEYKTRGDARRGLSAARHEDAFLADFLGSPYFHVTQKRIRPAKVGQRRFGYLITEAAPNLNPIVRLEQQVTAGRFVLSLTVTAGSVSAAQDVAPHLLRVLHRRLQLRLGGHVGGTTPPSPPKVHFGQAPGGPDLSATILQPPDVGQPHAVNLIQGYSLALPALSDFAMTLSPAGTYQALQQQIGWWPTATEATYGEIYGTGNPGYGFGIVIFIDFAGHTVTGGGETITPVDLSSVQDPATGYLVTGDGESDALVTLTNGQAGDSIYATSKSTLQASDVVNLAQAAANRLDAGLGP
jgi:hypothetical protein